MSKPERSRVMSFARAEAAIPKGERSIQHWQRGPLDVVFSLPVPAKEQTPQTQDEIYVIARGRGVLLHDGKRDPSAAGDLLFVAAGIDQGNPRTGRRALFLLPRQGNGADSLARPCSASRGAGR